MVGVKNDLDALACLPSEDREHLLARLTEDLDPDRRFERLGVGCACSLGNDRNVGLHRRGVRVDLDYRHLVTGFIRVFVERDDSWLVGLDELNESWYARSLPLEPSRLQAIGRDEDQRSFHATSSSVRTPPRNHRVSSVPDADVADLLAAYDTQVRARLPERLPRGAHAERDGPLLRFLGLGQGGFIAYRDVGMLASADLDELIARQIRVFAGRGEPFEWKLHAHDRPADLEQRLRAAGFVPESEETVVIATVAGVAGEPRPPEGVSLREVTDRGEFDRVAAMEDAIWQEERGWLAESLEAERAVDPDALAVVIAEAEDAVVCAGWVRFEQGTEFATLWGGATLPAWRGRGIYRSIVAYRANLAAQRGFRYLEVDAGDNSLPILERLGFVPVTTTTPFVWSPDTGESEGR
jgi:GNAT superfamily N-acetyltransferase